MAKLTRRLFIGTGVASASAQTPSDSLQGSPNDERQSSATQLRRKRAEQQSRLPAVENVANSDETSVPHHGACFAKGLPANQLGEVHPAAYDSLLKALQSGRHQDFEKILRGSGRRLKNPQASFSYCLEGGDPHRFTSPPAPAFSSPEMALDMTEMYWLALARDIPFQAYSNSRVIAQAAKELGTTGGSVFRGPTAADANGPYISQFLLKPVPTLSTISEQRYRVPASGTDFMTAFGEWLQIQTGLPPWRDYVWDPTHRYLRNGRDLAEWIHYDFLYQAFLNAGLILMAYGPESVLDDRRQVLNPLNPYKASKVQDGFATFGFAQVVDWLGRVTSVALKAAWAQKWLVHRRLRPETFGGRLHLTRTQAASYPIHGDVLNSMAVEETYKRWGSYLLPQSYPEGAPIHPSYPGGHATVAGACSIVLKAMFDEDMILPDCMEASADGLTLVSCPSGFSTTIGMEVNKLVSNVFMGRSWAGIHYRSDSLAGVRLGEDVAISVLQDLAPTFTEDFGGFRFTRFDGTEVRIASTGELE